MSDTFCDFYSGNDGLVTEFSTEYEQYSLCCTDSRVTLDGDMLTYLTVFGYGLAEYSNVERSAKIILH
jgi:hypothetical protein